MKIPAKINLHHFTAILFSLILSACSIAPATSHSLVTPRELIQNVGNIVEFQKISDYEFVGKRLDIDLNAGSVSNVYIRGGGTPSIQLSAAAVKDSTIFETSSFKYYQWLNPGARMKNYLSVNINKSFCMKESDIQKDARFVRYVSFDEQRAGFFYGYQILGTTALFKFSPETLCAVSLSIVEAEAEGI